MKTKKIFLSIICITLFSLYLLELNKEHLQLRLIGYNETECISILKSDIKQIKEIIDTKKKINITNWDKYPNEKFYCDYETANDILKLTEHEIILYIDKLHRECDDFFKQAGYSPRIIRKLFKYLSFEDFIELKNNNISWKNFAPYYDIPEKIIDDIPLYIESNLEPLKAILSISYPNINSSNKDEFLRNYIICDPSGIDVLIKKSFYIPDNYIPTKLINVNILNDPQNNNTLLREDAAIALQTMANDAKKFNLSIAIRNAYRSYDDQKEIYDYYFKIYPPEIATSLVALPGTSEHQLGLSVDLTSKSVIDGQHDVFASTPEYQWVKEHAHEYGFIYRYPANKTHITGATHEPWHYRYVGIELATKLYNENICLEEYILENGMNYKLKVINNK